MQTVTLTPADDIAGCPFFFDESQELDLQGREEQYYKIYNDGGHYVAIPYFHSYKKRPSELAPIERVFDIYYNEALKKQRQKERCAKLPRKPLDTESFIEYVTPILRARFPNHKVTKDSVKNLIARKRERLLPSLKTSKTSAFDLAFNSLYDRAKREGLKRENLSERIKTGLLALFPDFPDLDNVIAEKIEKKQRNFFARKKRFCRKAVLNRWNYFVTFTYDDRKHTAETFRKKLRKSLSNLHTRRGWKYMGVFEEAPETGRLHFHGLLYIPDGEMVGKIVEVKDYSMAQGKVQITHRNEFFAESFGRNDFEELNEMELKHGQTLNYLLKYIGKTGERIVYSRGIPTQVCKKLSGNDLVAKMQDFVEKFVLFDDTIDWERDVMHYTKWKQMTVIDILCNPPRAA